MPSKDEWLGMYQVGHDGDHAAAVPDVHDRVGAHCGLTVRRLSVAGCFCSYEGEYCSYVEYLGIFS